MPIFPLLLLAFLLVPVAEIYVLITVGGIVGAVPTIGLVVLTAVLGAALIRSQSLATLARIRADMDNSRLPAVALVEAGLLLIAGALLLTPGFLTDAIGFACLVPPLRQAMARGVLARLAERTVIHHAGPGARPGERSRREGRTLEGQFWREDE